MFIETEEVVSLTTSLTFGLGHLEINVLEYSNEYLRDG